jgi:tetratricopeptide (TPR) repeat protein
MEARLPWVALEGPDEQAALEELQDASEARIETSLRISREAAEAGDAVQWNLYGAKLAILGRFDEAQDMWQSLVEQCPEHGAGWLNLSACHAQLGDLGEAVAVMERGLSLVGEQEAQILAPQLQVLRRLCADTDNRELLLFRMMALMERIACGVADRDDERALTRAIDGLRRLEGFAALTPEVVLSAARRAHAKRAHVGVIEVLAWALRCVGERGELEAVVQALQKEAPQSSALADLRAAEAGGRPAPSTLHEHVSQLLDSYALGDSTAAGRLEALHDCFPDRAAPRMGLMVLAALHGDLDEAVARADELAAGAEFSVDVHLQIAQVYAHSGSADKALYHLRQAYVLADDEAVQQHVRDFGSRVGLELGTTGSEHE